MFPDLDFNEIYLPSAREFGWSSIKEKAHPIKGRLEKRSLGTILFYDRSIPSEYREKILLSHDGRNGDYHFKCVNDLLYGFARFL